MRADDRSIVGQLHCGERRRGYFLWRGAESKGEAARLVCRKRCDQLAASDRCTPYSLFLTVDFSCC